MENNRVLPKLHRKYAEMLTELRQHEAESRKIRADLAHLKAAIRLFDSEWEGADIKPIQPRSQSRWIKRGLGTQTALEVLRSATEPMTNRDIALAVMNLRGLETDSESVMAVATTINAMLVRKLGTGLIRHEGHPKRWSVVR